MYATLGGCHSLVSSPFHNGIIWGAHANNCGSTILPASDETQTQSQGPCQGYGQGQTTDFDCGTTTGGTPETSPRLGYHPDCVPQCGPRIPPTMNVPALLSGMGIPYGPDLGAAGRTVMSTALPMCQGAASMGQSQGAAPSVGFQGQAPVGQSQGAAPSVGFQGAAPSVGFQGAAPMIHSQGAAPISRCCPQVPVVFMMIPMVPSYQYQGRTDSQTDTSPSSSALSSDESGDKEEQPMRTQTAHDLPKPRFAKLTGASSKVPDRTTTLVVRNVPARYTPGRFLQEIEPDGSFDFLFLPYSFRDSTTIGVAFINFRSPDLALCFEERWQRQFLQDHGCNKHLDIAAATCQGIMENLQQFNDKNIARLARAGMLPIFLDSLGNCLNPLQELKRYRVV
eukprot:TRINITY_DN8140_c0_g1_i1.p1 TRINITY_DN8140_c0_g1~~TRINITY_DN8140_c0_g1_i1.p1  ORF type:complete len:395 (+),score=34.10 TRINITY_DN8140_c0_g1_i1:124-1308(+)